jgi:hypothetical protein
LLILNSGYGLIEDGNTKETKLSNSKNILVCPLDWGLGHATRCIPLIKQFVAAGHQVIIGADKHPLALLKLEFPELRSVVIPGYELSYGEKGSALKLFYESVQFFKFIKKEQVFIAPIIDAYKIDMIVSDNRYGLWSKKVTSIIITHQLYVKAPIGEKIAQKNIKQLIHNLDECWIPDVSGTPNFSGDLAHLKPFEHPHQFIGPLSRFSGEKMHTSRVFDPQKTASRSIVGHEYDVIAIISGPEPQRTIFEKLVFAQLSQNNLKEVVVRGLPANNFIAITAEGSSQQSPEKIKISPPVKLPYNVEKIEIFDHFPTLELLKYIEKSKVVVCRAGYSSIMDLSVLGKQAILVPTPGQTEQEYLAKYHFLQGNFYTQKQSEFNLQKGLIEIKNFTFSLPIISEY